MPGAERVTPEFLKEIARARRADAADRAAGRRAVSASFDRTRGRVLIELSNGSLFGFLASGIPALAGLSAQQLTRVTVSPGGIGIHWADVDVGLSVPGLLLDAVDRATARRELARLAGSSTSKRKAAAARANGKKGGRPRKRV